MQHHNQQSGFALLMTLIVVSVLISVGLTILDVSIKQLRLSTNSRDSEIAFHAANAGLECARYWRRVSMVEMEAGLPIDPPPSCFANVGSPSLLTRDTVTTLLDLDPSTNSGAWLYEHHFTWGSVEARRCTEIRTVIIRAGAAAGLTLNIGVLTQPPLNFQNGMIDLVPGYPDGPSKTCEAGGRCTVMSVRGYNRACTTGTYPIGTVQREVLLQF